MTVSSRSIVDKVFLGDSDVSSICMEYLDSEDVIKLSILSKSFLLTVGKSFFNYQMFHQCSMAEGSSWARKIVKCLPLIHYSEIEKGMGRSLIKRNTCRQYVVNKIFRCFSSQGSNVDSKFVPVFLINNYFYHRYRSKEKEFIEASAKDPKILDSLFEDDKSIETYLDVHGSKLMEDAILIHNDFKMFQKLFRNIPYLSLPRLKDFIILAVNKGNDDILRLLLTRSHGNIEPDFLADAVSKAQETGNLHAQRMLNDKLKSLRDFQESIKNDDYELLSL